MLPQDILLVSGLSSQLSHTQTLMSAWMGVTAVPDMPHVKIYQEDTTVNVLQDMLEMEPCVKVSTRELLHDSLRSLATAISLLNTCKVIHDYHNSVNPTHNIHPHS